MFEKIGRTQMSAHANHNKPLRPLHTLLVGLWVSELLDVDSTGLVNLILGPVSDEDGLSSPFDEDLSMTPSAYMY